MSGGRRFHLPLLLAIAAGVLIAGCAQFTPAPIVPAETAAALEGRRLDDERLRDFIASVSGAYADTAARHVAWDLSTLTLAAIYYHPQLEVTRAKLGKALAAIKTAGQIPNPALSLSPTKHTTILEPSSWTVGLLVNFVIETFGKREHRIAQAEQLAEAARADLATAAWQVRGRVRAALLALWAARHRQALIQRRQDLQQQLVGFLERRVSAGETSALDVSRERNNLNQVRLAMQDQQRQEAEARVQLAAAIGLPVRALDGVEISFAAFDQPAVDGPILLGLGDSQAAMRREALLHRSDVQSLLAVYEAAQAAVRLEIARQYPNITLGPGYTYDQGDNQYLLNLTVDLPVFHQNQGPIAEAYAQRREAAAQFTEIQAQIIAEIDKAVASYRSALQARAMADALVSVQFRRQQGMERALQAGEIDRIATVTSALELATAEQSRFDAIAQQRQAIELAEDALQRVLFENSEWVRPVK